MPCQMLSCFIWLSVCLRNIDWLMTHIFFFLEKEIEWRKKSPNTIYFLNLFNNCRKAYRKTLVEIHFVYLDNKEIYYFLKAPYRL